ncbi:MAG TPA: aminotransferase class V-fold PLP-dependent enzyme, partial [Candidatus Korarchaeota archaeon]|nr:aminotransferase class V-fold PLP-dependent enzyme [Candidatus Korarchaeota archaeon]
MVSSLGLPAIEGGKPVRGKENPLPTVFPREIGPKAMDYFRELVESGNTANLLERFDREFARVIGSKFALSLSNCTVACHTALAAAGVGPGDEVVVSPITDYGTIYGIIAQRAIPVFADVDKFNGNVTAENIEKVITDRTKALMVVHWAGIVCDMDPIIEVAKAHNLVLIEDCCQSILAKYKGRNSGTLGDIGCFSFDIEKHMSCGSGGAIVTNNEEYYERARNFAYARGSVVDDPDFGRRHKVLGNNYRFDIVRAALALAQLEILPRKVRRYM